jgi:hypothetical protein
MVVASNCIVVIVNQGPPVRTTNVNVYLTAMASCVAATVVVGFAALAKMGLCVLKDNARLPSVRAIATPKKWIVGLIANASVTRSVSTTRIVVPIFVSAVARTIRTNAASPSVTAPNVVTMVVAGHAVNVLGARYVSTVFVGCACPSIAQAMRAEMMVVVVHAAIARVSTHVTMVSASPVSLNAMARNAATMAAEACAVPATPRTFVWTASAHTVIARVVVVSNTSIAAGNVIAFVMTVVSVSTIAVTMSVSAVATNLALQTNAVSPIAPEKPVAMTVVAVLVETVVRDSFAMAGNA